MTKILSILALSSLSGLAVAQQGSMGPGQQGGCRSIVGVPSISSTTDDGLTWATNRRRLDLGQASFGIARLGNGDWLTDFQGTFFTSSDGCRWTRLGPAPSALLRLTGGAGDQALAWEFIPGPQIWSVHADSTGQGAVEPLVFLPTDVLTVAVDPADGTHMRAIGRNGQIYRSGAPGSHWDAVGTPAPVTPLTYFGALDPNDLDHAVIGMSLGGAQVTFDGGQTWIACGGLSSSGGAVNAFNGVVSPASSSIVWIQGLDLQESADGHPSGGRHVYRSEDGGLSFTPVVDAGLGITLTNGPVLQAHPTDTDVLYFPFGSRFMGGVNLYRYDHATGSTTWNFSPAGFQIRALAIDPVDTSRILAGFEG
jgi:hypothetical protein